MSLLGEGGFARIYRAQQLNLGRDVAIKLLNPGLKNDPARGYEVSARFRREAQLVASLRDPHTVIMHDYGQTDSGLLYMVFEYIDGLTLRELVRQQSRISAERVVKIPRQVLCALQEAHSLGGLHRDIKPANIMLYEHIGRTDQVKVLDFGIAKDVFNEDATMARDLTKAGMIIGTPRYMAPEQLRGEELGAYTDIYSLGLVAYELLSGRKANAADSMISIIARQISSESYELPAQLRLSPRSQALIHRMLHKSVAHRFQDSAEVIAALDELSPHDLAAGMPIAAAPPNTAAPLTQLAHPTRHIVESASWNNGISAEDSFFESARLDDTSSAPLAVVEGVVGDSTISSAAAGRRRVLLAGIFGVLLLVIAVVLGLFSGGDDETPMRTAESAAALGEVVPKLEATRASAGGAAESKTADENRGVDEWLDDAVPVPVLDDELDEFDEFDEFELAEGVRKATPDIARAVVDEQERAGEGAEGVADAKIASQPKSPPQDKRAADSKSVTPSRLAPTKSRPAPVVRPAPKPADPAPSFPALDI